MVLFNYATKELTAKVVYYGPGLCGKTTNLQHIYDTLPGNAKGKMLSLATKTDRTLFFDFLPIDLGTIRGMKTKIQLYTVPGQVFYDTTRKLVLKGADGVVFVADSQEAMLDANLDSFDNLIVNLRDQNMEIENMPHVIQYNKRDMKNVMSVEDLDRQVNRYNTASFEAVAPNGIGVFETLKGISKLVLKNLGQRYGLETDSPKKKTPVVEPVSPAPAPAPPKPEPPKPEPVAPIAPAPVAPKPAPATFEMPVAAEPKPPAPAAQVPKPAPKISLPPSSHMEEIEFIEDDTIEKADAVLHDEHEAFDFDEPSVDLDDSSVLADSEGLNDDPFGAPFSGGDELKPLPELDDSEVIELDDVEPIEMNDLDDMAEIAHMASEESTPSTIVPQMVKAQLEPIVVPISINLPTALGGQPLLLQINITFED